MATGIDPEEGVTVYANARSHSASGTGNNVGTGFVVTPTPDAILDRTPSATLTSEQGGGNEPPPPSQAGIHTLATNLDRQLAQLSVGHQQVGQQNPAATTTNGHNVPVVEDLLDIPGTYSIRSATLASPHLSATPTGPGVNTGNGNEAFASSIFKAHTVQPDFSYIRNMEGAAGSIQQNYQFALRTPDTGSVGLAPTARHTATTEVKDNTTKGRGRDPDGSVGSSHNPSYYSAKSVRSGSGSNEIKAYFEQANHQVSMVVGEIQAQESPTDDISNMSNSFRTPPSTASRTNKSWKEVIGSRNMKNLIRLGTKERNAVVEALTWYSMAAESDAELFNFATEEIDSKRGDTVTPVQHRSEPPIPVQTPVSPPMGPDTPEFGFNEFQPSMTPETPPPGSTATSVESRVTPSEPSPAGIEFTTGAVPVTGSNVGKVSEPVTGSLPVTGAKMEKPSVPVTGSSEADSPLTSKGVLDALRTAQAEIASASTKQMQELKLKEMQFKQILSSSADSVVPKLPEPLSDNSVARWFEDVCYNLRASPWNIDGTSIYDLHNSDLDPEEEVNMEYKIRNEQLSKHLYTRLREAKKDDLVDELRETYSKNDGVALLNAVYKGLLPKHAAQILQLLSELGTVRHKNKETMPKLHSRLNQLFKRIKDLGYETIDQLFVAYTQLAIFDGHYKGHESVKQERIEVDHHQRDLKRFTTPREFTDSMHQVFLNNQLLKPGANEMKAINASTITGTARRATGGGEITEPSGTSFTSEPPSNGRKFAYASTGDQVCLDKLTVFDTVNYLKYTNCPLCKYPKNHPNNHYPQNCPHAKELGLEIKYVADNDKHRPSMVLECCANWRRRRAVRNRESVLLIHLANQFQTCFLAGASSRNIPDR